MFGIWNGNAHFVPFRSDVGSLQWFKPLFGDYSYVSSDFVFLFGREVDLGGRILVRIMLVHLPLDGSVCLS